MKKRQLAMELLDTIPENKLDYIIAFLQGAAISVKPENAAALADNGEVRLTGTAQGVEKSIEALFSGNAMSEAQFMSDSSGMDDVYSALEDMARAEISLYQKKDK